MTHTLLQCTIIPENFRKKKILEAMWLPKLKYPSILIVVMNFLDDVIPSEIKFH